MNAGWTDTDHWNYQQQREEQKLRMLTSIRNCLLLIAVLLAVPLVFTLIYVVTAA